MFQQPSCIIASNDDVNPSLGPTWITVMVVGGGEGGVVVVAVVEGGGGDGVCAVTSGHNSRASQELSRVSDKGVQQRATTEEMSLMWWLG